MSEPQTYRQMLRDELKAITEMNPQYSLRALSGKLDISPSLLSSVINGKKDFSLETAQRVAKCLKFNRVKTDLFLTLLRMETTKSEDLRTDIAHELKLRHNPTQAKQVEAEQFSLLEDWRQVAILELASLPNRRVRLDELPAAIGEEPGLVSEIVQRLTRLGLLSVDGAGTLRKAPGKIVVSSSEPNRILRDFHRQMLKKAESSIETQTSQEKFIGSETFGFDPAQLSEAEQVIEECFAKLIRLASLSEKRREVYHVGIQFFRLAKLELK